MAFTRISKMTLAKESAESGCWELLADDLQLLQKHEMSFPPLPTVQTRKLEHDCPSTPQAKDAKTKPEGDSIIFQNLLYLLPLHAGFLSVRVQVRTLGFYGGKHALLDVVLSFSCSFVCVFWP